MTAKTETAAPEVETETLEVEALTFEDAPIPAPKVKAAKPNPFTEIVASMVPLMGTADAKARAVTVSNATLKERQRQLNTAGVAAGISVRQRAEAVAGDRTRIVFYPVPKITRPRPATVEATVPDATAEATA